MKFPWTDAGRVAGLLFSMIALLLGLFAPYVTAISSVENLRTPDSLPSGKALQRAGRNDGTESEIRGIFERSPLRFEENAGQFDKPVRFLVHGRGYSLALSRNEVVLRLEKAEERKRNSCEEVVGDCERLKLPLSAFCLAPSSSTVARLGNPQQSESQKSGEWRASTRISRPQSVPEAERSENPSICSSGRSPTQARFDATRASPVTLTFIAVGIISRLPNSILFLPKLLATLRDAGITTGSMASATDTAIHGNRRQA
jgi:hypothetical protein